MRDSYLSCAIPRKQRETCRGRLYSPRCRRWPGSISTFYGRYEFRKGPETINMDEIVQELAQLPVRHILKGKSWKLPF